MEHATVFVTCGGPGDLTSITIFMECGGENNNDYEKFLKANVHR